MIQIRPQEKFPIVYRIADPNDSATYYVRAVIRNSVSGAVIKNGTLSYVNLIQDASDLRRYAASIQAPNDASGQGFYIDVTTKVYTDSGYSAQSLTYLEKNDTYLVQERWSTAFGGGGGGYIDWPSKLKEAIDYSRIEEAFKAQMKSLPPMPVPSDRFDEVIGHIQGIKIPAPAKIDLEGHTARLLEAFAKEVRKIKIPDHSEILKRIDSIKFPDIPLPEALKPHVEALKAHMTKELSAVREMLPKKEHRDIMNELADRIVGRTEKEDPKVNRVKNLLL